MSSGPIRTRIGLARRRLRLHIDPVKSTLSNESATGTTPLGDRSNEEILEEIHVLLEIRAPFVKAYKALLKEHDAFSSLRTSSASEEEEFNKYITNYGDYTVELAEASDLIAKMDASLDKLMAEAKSRDLATDEDNDDALTMTTAKSIDPSATPRPPLSVALNGQPVPAEHSLPGRTISNSPKDDVQGEIISTSFAPTTMEPPPQRTPPTSTADPQVVYVPSDTASAFVTAALVGKTLPHFSGEILSWPEFHESFTSLIRHGKITGSDKLSLLRMCLSGEAREIIAGLPKLDRNFDHAMLLLEKEYDKPHLRHHSLLSRLRNLSPCDRDGKNLRSFYLKLNVIVRQLLPNGELDSPDLLVNLITSKLPPPMQTRIIKESSRKSEFGVYNVLSILADAVEDEKIEKEIMANNRVERRSDKPHPTSLPLPTHQETKERTTRPRQQPARLSNTPRTCRFCEGSHGEDSCPTYTTPEDRKTAVIQMKLCLNCLRPNHRANECTSRFRCRKCKEPHHTSTCRTPSSTPSPTTQRQVDPPRAKITPPPAKAHQTKSSAPRRPQQKTHCVLTEEFEETTMATSTADLLPINSETARKSTQPLLCLDIDIHSPYDPTSIVRATAMFDSASSCSYISSDLATALKLPVVQTRKIAVQTFGKKHADHRTVNVFPVGLRLMDGSLATITTLSSPLICGTVDWLKKEADIISPVSSQPKLLLGMDCFLDLFFGDQFSMTRTDEGLHILSTPLGEVATTKRVSSRAFHTILVNPNCTTHLDSTPDSATRLEEMVRRHFSLELIGVMDSPAVDDDDNKALAHFLANIRYDSEEGRYYVALPFREETPNLPTNFGLALKRLVINTTTLARRPENLAKYDAIFEEQLKEGILEEVPKEELYKKDGVHYLSHFGIVKETSATTKLRAVLDGSAHSKENPSLNSCLFRGPVILPDLFGSLIRARTTTILLCADIAKAFLQVGLEERSRDFTRLLWIKNPSRPPSMENIIIYRFRRVPFGLNCSPFLLAMTIRHHLDLHPCEWTEMIRDTYVDNYFGRAETVEEGVRQFHEVREFFAKASFNLREFVSNHPSLNELFVNSNAAASDLENAKILGIHWNTKMDTLSLPPVKIPSDNTKWTKRHILCYIAGLFDPLGIITPATLPMKIFLQALWKTGSEWDTELPPDLTERWNSMLQDFHSSSLSTTIPRLAIRPSLEGSSTELHVFVDASQHAYSAVAYLVCRQPDGFGSSSLLASKARVAPVKGVVNIPRMELLANLLGALLASNIIRELSTVSIAKTVLWTDSMINLCWLKNESRKELPVFVRNRISKISSLLPSATFYHIDGELNPADVASRGCTGEDLQTHHLWWKGPPFLVRPPSSWNPQPVISSPLSKEITLTTRTFDTPIEEPKIPIIDATRFSSWEKIVNTLLFVLLFIRKMKKPPSPANSRTSLYRQSELLLFKICQQEFPPSQLLIDQLRMFRCPSTSLWRCRGRIDKAEIPLDAKTPIYLPRESAFTRLYILHRHESINHFGQLHTLTDLRQRVWIPKGLSTTKSALRHCMRCMRKKAQPFRLPEFPDLPAIRTEVPQHPFSALGMDLAGPMIYRNMDGSRSKCWIMLLTCLHTRATYLDVICDMSTRTLLSRLRRFVATYGAPSMIVCDNAPSFTALSQLQSAFRQPEEHTDLTDYCARQAIEFRFITPFSPWSGGIYERLVGLTKTALKAVIGSRTLSLEDLDTLVKECAATLNTRPLTYVGSDLDFTPLRPIDFIRPHASLALPRLKNENEDTDTDWKPRQVLRDTLVDSWTRSTVLLKRFWTRWQREYLTSLREKYQREHAQGRLVTDSIPRYGDVILVSESGLDRGQWKLGRIIEVKNDRSAIVKTATGTLHRPLSLLYKMEIEDNKEEAETLVNKEPSTEVRLPDRPRRSARLNPTTATLLTLLLFSTHVSATAPDTRCPSSTSFHTDMLYVSPCVSNGIGIAKEKIDDFPPRLCWIHLECPRGHLRLPNSSTINKNYCGPECQCPSWTKMCSFYSGKHVNDSSASNLPAELKNYVPSHVCSFYKEDHCDQNALFGLFSKIELMDGTSLIVPELDVTTTDVYSPDDHRCLDVNGMELQHQTISSLTPVTGTSSFCNVHTCTTETATVFCFYGEKITAYVLKDFRIPIRAWGTIRQLYYQHSKNATEEILPFTISCAHLGLELLTTGGTNGLSVRACIGTYCIFLQNVNEENSILYPWSIVSEDYDVVIQHWMDGVSYPDKKIHCSARPLCERVRCRLCLSFLLIPSCWSIIDLIVSIVIILVVGYLISRILDLCKIFSILTRCIRRCLCCLLRQNPSHGKQAASRFHVPRRFRWKRAPLYSATLSLTLFSLIPYGRPCSEVTSMRAEEHECSRSGDGILHCSISNSVVLTLRPMGQTSCLIVRDSAGKIGSVLSVRVDNISHRCDKQSMFHTRDHSFTTKNHHICGNYFSPGYCDDIKCSSVESSGSLPFFDKSSPGFNFCASSCGCVTCGGCVSCSPSCIFYRLSVYPSTDTIYEAFRCLQWITHVTVHVSVESSTGTTSEHSMDLRPGETSRWNDVKLTLLSSSVTHSPLLSSHFLTDGKRTTIIEDAAPSLFTPGSAGQLQCSSRESASSFDCQFRASACTCSTGSTAVSCTCPDGDLNRFFKGHHVLPLVRQGLRLAMSPSGIEAYTSDNQVLQLKINLENLILDSMTDINDCEVAPSSAIGCFNCLAGAKTELSCTSSMSTTSTTLTCIDDVNTTIISTVIHCKPQGHRQSIAFSSSTASILLNCSFRCPGGAQAKFFPIEGSFLYVDEVGPDTSSGSLQENTYSKKTFDFPSIPSGPVALIITIVMIIIILLIIAFLLPRVCIGTAKKFV